MTQMNAIPKLLYQPDTSCTRKMLKVIKSGGSLALFPEGIQSISGSTHPINPATCKFIKKAGLPVVFAYNLNKVNINDVNLKWLKFELGLSLDFLVNYKQEIQGVVVKESNPWNKVVLNTVVGVRVCVKDNFEIGLRTVNAMTSICKSSRYPYGNGNVVYIRRLFGRYGMFNDVLQLAVFWKI